MGWSLFFDLLRADSPAAQARRMALYPQPLPRRRVNRQVIVEAHVHEDELVIVAPVVQPIAGVAPVDPQPPRLPAAVADRLVSIPL